MKRIVILIMSIAIMVSLLPATVVANDSSSSIENSTVEYLENGDYIVTELEADHQIRLLNNTLSTKPGSKTKTYFNSSGTKIWSLTVNATFSYTYGVSATATGATATVNIYSTGASFVRKSAYTSGNTATATGTVAYNSVEKYMTVSVSCDKYGNLS